MKNTILLDAINEIIKNDPLNQSSAGKIARRALAQHEEAASWEPIGHFYDPIAFYNGEILKYQGIVTQRNQQHLQEKHPDGITLPNYKGDRIRAKDFSII